MRFAALAVALLLLGCRNGRDDATLDVYAAASLTDVLEVLADSFEVREGGRYRVRLNLAGSSLLARQIARGARADVFVSAHPSWTELLRREGRLVDVHTLPISNDLVLVSRETEGALDGRLALADPEHVPAGMYARSALECEGLWSDLEDRIVPTLDVRAALTAVSEGAAESAIVYASDALHTPALRYRAFVSDKCRPDVRYTVGITESQNEGAVRFLSMLSDTTLRSTWRQFGFNPAQPST